jgi:3-oxoacyl-[acyl-carrier-protein] synthase II
MSLSTPRRIVITGMGLVSPLGNSHERLWEGLATGRSGVGRLRSLPTDHLPINFGAEAWDFTGQIQEFGKLEAAQQKTIRKGLKVMCREIQMGVAAAQHALQDAGLKLGGYDCDRTGCVYGSDYIMTVPDEFTEAVRHCVEEGRFQFARWAEQGLPRVTPLWLLKYLPNMPASHLAIYNDLRGPSNSITLREASANLALAEAYCTIARNSADIMVVGATGTRVHPIRTVHVALQEELAVGTGDPTLLSRPFDRDRAGLIVGEGAGAVILEELQSAQARGARILGEIIGYGSSARMQADGTAECDLAIETVLRLALKTSGLAPHDVGHINTHGAGTRRGDAQEARAIARVFGSDGEAPPVVAAKSYFGNLGAGGGIVEFIASLLALQHDRLFPILNYATRDPDCPIRAARSDDKPGDAFIKTNYSPQSQASAIVVRRFA